MRRSPDRWIGAGAVLIAIATVLEALTFKVTFYTDPLGAGGLPIIAASLIGLGGLTLVIRPQTRGEPITTVPMGRGTALVASLFAYALLLPILGFIAATALALALQSMIFGGPSKRSVVLAMVYTAALFLLFGFVLGLPLPIGRLFLRGS